MKNARLYGLALVLVLLSVAAARAGDPPAFAPKTRSVAVFKNGIGFFLCEGEATLSDGWAMSEKVPPAALGTFWVGSPSPKVTVERLMASREDIKRVVPADNVGVLLSLNIGKRIRFPLDGKITEGKVISFAAHDDQTHPSSIAVIRTETSTLVVNKEDIPWVEFLEPVNSDNTATDQVQRLRFKVTGVKDKAQIGMGYLRKGITWSPAYLVELLDDRRARITMQGLLANDAEDIAGAEICFVVGYPNFMFADIASPIALSQSVTDFVRGITSNGNSGGYGGIAYQSAPEMAALVADSNFDQPPPDNYYLPFGYSSQQTAGTSDEDLFLYRIKDVSMKTGERGYFTIFSAEVPLEHIYEWDVPDTSRVQSGGYMDQSSAKNTAEPRVWHKLKLKNNTKYPWTTGPGMAMSSANPLAQDTLSYTPVGGDGTLRITQAGDITTGRSETEKSRENDAIRVNTVAYSRITVDGELVLKNHKAKQVTVVARKTITGEVVSTSPQAVTTKSAESVKGVNPTTRISWEIPLKAGEERKLQYTYFVYVH